jgi:hypothetical protein
VCLDQIIDPGCQPSSNGWLPKQGRRPREQHEAPTPHTACPHPDAARNPTTPQSYPDSFLRPAADHRDPRAPKSCRKENGTEGETREKHNPQNLWDRRGTNPWRKLSKTIQTQQEAGDPPRNARGLPHGPSEVSRENLLRFIDLHLSSLKYAQLKIRTQSNSQNRCSADKTGRRIIPR